MKIKFVVMVALLVSTAFAAQAQPGNRRTVEERVKTIHEKMDSAFKLDAASLTKVDSAFTTYYKGTDKLREEMRSGGERPDFEAIRQKMQPLSDARDKELKTVLSADQFKKWKDEIEPALMPRRGGGGPGGNRQ